MGEGGSKAQLIRWRCGGRRKQSSTDKVEMWGKEEAKLN